MNTIQGFHHVAIKTPDFEKSLAFYRDVLGFHVKVAWGRDDDRAALLDCGDGRHVEIFACNDAIPETSLPLIHFALRCSDIDATLDRVAQHGCQISMGKTRVEIEGDEARPIVEIAFFIGPAGETVELFNSNDL